MVGPGGDYMEKFLERYQCEFGFTISCRPVIVDDIRVRAAGRSTAAVEVELPPVDAPAVAEKVMNYIN